MKLSLNNTIQDWCLLIVPYLQLLLVDQLDGSLAEILEHGVEVLEWSQELHIFINSYIKEGSWWWRDVWGADSQLTIRQHKY